MLTPGSKYVCAVEADVLEPVDVLVAGGGASGVTAALSAARNGARTLLVENTGRLGGMLTSGNAGITMFTKFSGRPEDHARDMETLKTRPGELHVAGGITMEIARRLLDTGAGIGNHGTPASYVFTSSEDFKRLLFDMAEEAGVRLRLHARVVDVVKDGDRVAGAVIESKSGRQVLPAAQFIDATGDGDLCARAGAAYTVGVTDKDLAAKKTRVGAMMPMGVMFKVGNVDMEKTFAWLADNPRHFLEQQFALFTFEEVRERFRRNDNATLRIVREDETPPRFQIYNLPTPGVVTLCCPHIHHKDGRRSEDLTEAELDMSKLLVQWLDSIRRIPGFGKCFLLHVPEIGVRETRHIEGDHVLDIMDVYHQRHFDDCIAFGAHPIDTHPRPDWLDDPKTCYPPRWYFEIPFRSLLVKGLANVQVAGRAISATHEAFGCIRPTVQCMSIGEAAGAAAALAVAGKTDPRRLGVELLRDTLKKQGVRC